MTTHSALPTLLHAARCCPLHRTTALHAARCCPLHPPLSPPPHLHLYRTTAQNAATLPLVCRYCAATVPLLCRYCAATVPLLQPPSCGRRLARRYELCCFLTHRETSSEAAIWRDISRREVERQAGRGLLGSATARQTGLLGRTRRVLGCSPPTREGSEPLRPPQGVVAPPLAPAMAPPLAPASALCIRKLIAQMLIAFHAE